MNDSSKIALAILGGAVLVSGTLAWLGYSIRAASKDCAAPVAAATAGVTGTPTALAKREPQEPTAAAEATVLRVTDFVERWEKGGYQGRAETECFKPAEQAKKPVTATLDFAVEVDASGRVVKVEPRDLRGELGDLYGCVGKVVQSMMFPPTGARRTGEGQASRPNAFVTGEPATPSSSRR